jgi:hypothetical protein
MTNSIKHHDHSDEGDFCEWQVYKAVLYFFLLMLYKTPPYNIDWLCAVAILHFFTHLRWIWVFPFIKSKTPLTRTIMNLKKKMITNKNIINVRTQFKKKKKRWFNVPCFILSKTFNPLSNVECFKSHVKTSKVRFFVGHQ